MIYNWVHGADELESAQQLAEQLVEIDTVVAFKDSTPHVEQFYASSRRQRQGVRSSGPYMSVKGCSRLYASTSSDGTISSGSLCGAGPTRILEAHLARRRGSFSHWRTHSAPRSCCPKLLVPGRPRRVCTGTTQQLKALMKLLASRAGTVHRPRLPITRPRPSWR